MEASVSRVVSALPRRARWSACAPALQHVRRSSFIKQVMEQVKKDMEADAKLKKDWDTVQQSTERMRRRSRQQEESLRGFSERVQSVSSDTAARLNEWRERTRDTATAASARISQTVDQNEALKAAAERVRTGLRAGSENLSAVSSRTKSVLASGVDRVSAVFSYLGDEHKTAERHKEWKAQRDSVKAAAEAAEKRAEGAAEGAPAGEASRQEPADALVVSEARSSSWDRLGAGLRDMPFLHSVFENPLFDQLFGESEIAASIREMKEIDYRFHLEEFAEEIEYVVAPHVISSFLHGDAEALQKHCGDAAFAAVNASIKARKQQKLTLDSAILAGPKEFELKGAKLMEQGAPCFIWTFNTQQVNCLRDGEGEIIEGAVDDIRTVHYAMAVTRHPDLEKLDLEYPWQVSELAILGNQPCW